MSEFIRLASDRTFLGLRDYLFLQREWSTRTFGPGIRANGVCDHIEKELAEVRENPSDVMEWADIVILALDGAMRSGHGPLEIVAALIEKQDINFKRKWPEPTGKDEAVEHVREEQPTP